MNAYDNVDNFRCAPLRIKKALWIFRELILRTRTTRVAFFRVQKFEQNLCCEICSFKLKCTKMRLSTGLCTDPLEELTALPLPQTLLLNWVVANPAKSLDVSEFRMTSTYCGGVSDHPGPSAF